MMTSGEHAERLAKLEARMAARDKANTLAASAKEKLTKEEALALVRIVADEDPYEHPWCYASLLADALGLDEDDPDLGRVHAEITENRSGW